MSNTLELAKELVRRPSVTPDDAGCQVLMRERLAAIGFRSENLPFGDVSNFWARRGNEAPLLVFAGHTDVVPPGPLDQWHSDPFTPDIRDGMLYGRGAADMKGSLAAMITACEAFIAAHPDHNGSIGYLITSDEEGPAVNGTVKVVEHLLKAGEKIDLCLIGEPSSSERIGDVIKNGRRGSLNGKLVIHGRQGHVAYPHLASNPVHLATAALVELVNTEWDHGNQYFPPTSFQISNVEAGTGAENIIPGDFHVMFNLRYSPELTEQKIRNRIHAILDKYELNYTLEWRLSGEPFLTPTGTLVDAAIAAIRAVSGIDATLSTSGGTSDGRFIAPTGAQVLELGPVNATIHQVNECVSVTALDELAAIYRKMLVKLLT